MKKQKLALAIGVAALAMSSGMAYATNVITFNGEVVEQTCDAVANDGDYTVMLDQVAKSSLAAVGPGEMYDGLSTPFSIQVKDCPDGVEAVGAVLASSTYDADSGNLTDVAGYGSDAVQIQVMDGTDTSEQVKVGANEPVTYISTVNNAASIPMTAYYYVKTPNAVEAGTIVTTATYVLRTQ